MSGHAPGPWDLVGSVAPLSRIHVADDNGHPVCSVPKNRMADAHLIAAAPDLLGVVQGFQTKLQTYVSVYPGDKELQRLLDESRAAIAKATGEQP